MTSSGITGPSSGGRGFSRCRLRVQLHDGGARAPLVEGRRTELGDQRVRLQVFPQAAPEAPGAFPMHDHRIGAWLERRHNRRVFAVGRPRKCADAREVWRQNELVEITSIEFDILEVLARSAGRVVTRDELTAVLYQRRATPYERSLDVHISHLRKKLEGVERPLIHTIRGVGYLLSGTAETV